MGAGAGVHTGLAVALAAVLTFAQAATPSVDAGALDPRVAALLAPTSADGAPGCAVAYRSGGAVKSGAAGLAQLEHGVAITPATAFHAASVSKQFTAFAVLLLAQDGKLGLDDDVRKHIPELPNFGRPVTVAQLMHHTAGLREQGALLSLAGWRADDVATQQDMLDALSRQRRLNFEPGAEVVYNNGGYTLLAEVVRRVSGQPLRVFAQQRIFDPLGMAHTGFRDDHNDVIAQSATGYRPRNGGGWLRSQPAFDHHGSTNLSTTVGDLMTWSRNLIDGRVGGPAAQQGMRRSGRLNDGTEIGYGGGLLIGQYGGLRTVSHDGVDHGFRANLLVFPDQDAAFAALCNGSQADVEGLTRRIAEVVLAGKLVPPALPERAARPAAEIARLAGTYWSPRTDEVLRLNVQDGNLRRRGDAREVIAGPDGAFRVTGSNERWVFGTTNGTLAGTTSLDVFDQWPVPRPFVRVDEPLPSAERLQALAGRYWSPEIGAAQEVRIVDGRPVLHYGRGVIVALEPVGGDRFVGSLGTVSFTRGAGGEVDGLTISNRRLRRLAYQRLPV